MGFLKKLLSAGVSDDVLALKEAAESEYWIYLLEQSGYYDESYQLMKELLDETKRMLVSTIKTTKKNGV